MYIAFAFVVVAIGAILKYAVADRVDGVELGSVGLILMLLGIAGAIIAAFAEYSRRHRTTQHVVERPDGIYQEEIRHK